MFETQRGENGRLETCHAAGLGRSQRTRDASFGSLTESRGNYREDSWNSPRERREMYGPLLVHPPTIATGGIADDAFDPTRSHHCL